MTDATPGECERCEGEGQWTRLADCTTFGPDCACNGERITERCPDCRGTGFSDGDADERLTVVRKNTMRFWAIALGVFYGLAPSWIYVGGIGGICGPTCAWLAGGRLGGRPSTTAGLRRTSMASLPETTE